MIKKEIFFFYVHLNRRGDFNPGPGYHPLQVAVHVENISLIKHIVALGRKELGGDQLLSLGNPEGVIPLTIAVRKGHYFAVKTLIELGSPVNIATVYHRTPLWYALEDTSAQLSKKNIAKLLLRNEAVINPRLSLCGIKRLMTAQKEMSEEDKVYVMSIVNNSKFSRDLAKIIADYAPLENSEQICEEITSEAFLEGKLQVEDCSIKEFLE